MAGVLRMNAAQLSALLASMDWMRMFELSERFKGLRDPSAAITWARELMGVSKSCSRLPSSMPWSIKLRRSASPIRRTCESCALFFRIG
ncbi:hypothetical protein H8A99_05840 [Bradyrhizobium sp. Arg68]|uniref:hypothetical protein n=1 Tax=Bradyrhizobium ivorense TaxID=2511166 RepID=UPI001E50A27D|nr:hypothetical protein [Bradyrhizobium ivorense]MCC8936025.1 hypothetical protein [Bradyrhizobium ivorense]